MSEIRVLPGDWGEAVVADIERVCASAAEALTVYFPGRDLPVIEVSKSNEGFPRTLNTRGPSGEVRVTLDIKGLSWARFAFEFAHEFCHVLCESATAKYLHRNLWFEQAICEVASLFALGQMAEIWKTRAPYPNWIEYAPKLQNYRDERIAKADGESLPELLREHEDLLRQESMSTKGLSPTMEAHLLTMAVQILPLLEGTPGRWEAIGYLNTIRGDESRSFVQYLSDWSSSSPDKHREFIRQIAEPFGVSV